MEEMLKCVRVNTAVYEKKFRKIEAGKITWNWCSFFFGCFWFLYRKMYKEFFAIFAITAVLYVITLAAPNSIISSIISVTVAILLGTMGDKIYYYHIKKIVEESGNEEAIIEKRGGTSAIAVFIGFVAYSLIFALIWMS